MINERFQKLQKKHLIPNKYQGKRTTNYLHRIPIQMLRDGDIFGEVALLTNLKRTCTVVTTSTCIFQTLTRNDLDAINDEFPNLHSCFIDSMEKYNDEDMMDKKCIVGNIPYLRGMTDSTLQRVVYLMKQQVYEKGEEILNCNMTNDHIVIIWDGKVQVRIEQIDEDGIKLESFWFANLEKGACISIFKCFNNQKSILSYYVSTSNCIVYTISASDLDQLAGDIPSIGDRLKVIKMKLKNNMLTDLDFITFPKWLLQK